ncbi:sigma-54-dependent transcriptional regulator [Desulfobacterium sp. N47]|uniref:Alginate biosynthesis transcriptional regulatory protein algB n=1 Tax=uncultured Desulfobacterium sp. TaxID=201089 RepID=E1YG22_9BACT|nr:Alginate biosynthesis transcriptional regulatory protein algB [uncultured Desulfobacterium sp.]
MMRNKNNSTNLSILIVDDETNIRKTLTVCLESRGHRVIAVSNAKDARAEADRRVFDLSFVDLRLGTDNGLDLIPALLSTSPWLKIIVITAYASVNTAVEAMRRGATDYIPKPFTPEQVELVTNRVAMFRSMEQRIATLKEDIERLHPEISFTSEHPDMQRSIALAQQVAPSEAVVLLRGPSGTGKTLLARAIHSWSRRADKPFSIVSCPTLSSELFESELFGHIKGSFTGALRDNPGRITACEGGTLFLDEIGDLPLIIQPKLLRFIQDHEYERVGDQQTRKANVRIIAATNIDIDNAVMEKKFREDLYYRLNVIQIYLPKLADHSEDIEYLAKNMLNFFGAQNHKVFRGFSDEAMKALRKYSWPGNIRELRNVVERAAILSISDPVGIENLPSSIAPYNPPVRLGDRVTLEVIEENHIRRIIAFSKSLQEAADILGIDQATLWRKRKQYSI